jgi:hypothetical protein
VLGGAHPARELAGRCIVAEVRIRPLYPLRGFAEDFGVSRTFARREIKEGRLPAFMIGRMTLIAGEDALEWRELYRDPPRHRRPPRAD